MVQQRRENHGIYEEDVFFGGNVTTSSSKAVNINVFGDELSGPPELSTRRKAEIE